MARRIAWLTALLLLMASGLILSKGAGAAPRHPAKAKAAEPPPEAEDSQEAGDDSVHELTKADINRIRFSELLTLRAQDPQDPAAIERVRVMVPREAAEQFVSEMAGKRFYEGNEGRNRFMKLTPENKLREIVRETGVAYADRVEIRSDPAVFLMFRRKVLPRVIQGCGTANCHGGVSGDKLNYKLWDDPKRSEQALYRNFLLLDETQLDYGKGDSLRRYFMIDRARPEESLLLAWLVKGDLTPVPLAHPGKAKVQPVFYNITNEGYQDILGWIGMLRIPRPDYGVRLQPPPGSQPVEPNEDRDGPGK